MGGLRFGEQERSSIVTPKDRGALVFVASNDRLPYKNLLARADNLSHEQIIEAAVREGFFWVNGRRSRTGVAESPAFMSFFSFTGNS
jgi:hypothetical protein